MGESPAWMQRRLDARRHAPDQQCRRRDELRDARALPAAARLRPRPARRTRHRGAPRGRRREDDHARRSRAYAVECRPPDLRRRTGPAGHRRHHGWRRRRGVGRRPPRSCSSRPTSKPIGHREHRRSGSACDRRRARVSSAASTRTGPARVRPGPWSCCAEVAGAVPAPGAIDFYPAPVERPRITVRTARVNQLLGTTLSEAEIADYLTPLGIEVSGSEALGSRRSGPTSSVRSTSSKRWRAASGSIASLAPCPSTRPSSERSARTSATAAPSSDVLVGAGYDEVFTLPLLAPSDLAAAGVTAGDVIEVENPLRGEESILRPVVAAGLVARRSRTTPRTVRPTLRCSRSAPSSPRPPRARSLPAERRALGVRAFASRAPTAPRAEPSGRRLRRDRGGRGDSPGATRSPTSASKPASVDGLHPTPRAPHRRRRRARRSRRGGRGRCRSTRSSLAGPVVACEIDARRAARRRGSTAAARPVSRFPASSVDLAFVVDDAVPAGRVLDTLTSDGRRAARTRRAVRRLPLRRARARAK